MKMDIHIILKVVGESGLEIHFFGGSKLLLPWCKTR